MLVGRRKQTTCAHAQRADKCWQDEGAGAAPPAVFTHFFVLRDGKHYPNVDVNNDPAQEILNKSFCTRQE